jgi:hypothetical protein
MDDNFCIFILTHGRPDKVVTLRTLNDMGYTGKYYLVLDNTDKTIDQYINNYGEDKILVFDKLAISKNFDTMDIFDDMRAVVYARNYCFEAAKQLNIEYFIELDDDYKEFECRWNIKGEFCHKIETLNLDLMIGYLLDFYKSTNITCLAIAQNGDFIGGFNGDNPLCKYLMAKRKAMNFMLCSTLRPFKWIGRINEDVNAYVLLGSQGKLFLTINILSVKQKDTQQNSGGLTDIYLNLGTYVKSFYTVICHPSSVKISLMGEQHHRIHHRIKWKYTTPCILDEKYKKR